MYSRLVLSRISVFFQVFAIIIDHSWGNENEGGTIDEEGRHDVRLDRHVERILMQFFPFHIAPLADSRLIFTPGLWKHRNTERVLRVLGLCSEISVTIERYASFVLVVTVNVNLA